MARKREPSPPSPPVITPERAGRLCKLLGLLGADAQTRATLMKRLKVDVRGFYRDLQLLRTLGIEVTLEEGRYTLQGDASDARGRVPLPDPHLTLAEATQLSRGRTAAHQKLKDLLGNILPG